MVSFYFKWYDMPLQFIGQMVLMHLFPSPKTNN